MELPGGRRLLLPTGKALPADEFGTAAGAVREHGPELGDAPRMIKVRHIGNCYRADPAYGRAWPECRGYR